MVHGGKIHDPTSLNRRAIDYLEEFRNAQRHLTAEPVLQPSNEAWKPPPQLMYKLNFDATLFMDLNRTGFGTVIRNDRGEVMAAMSTKGPVVNNSEEAEMLACRKSIEFVMDAGFSELVIEGGNANVIRAISSLEENQSLLRNVVEDIQQLLSTLRWGTFAARGGEETRLHMFLHNMVEIY